MKVLQFAFLIQQQITQINYTEIVIVKHTTACLSDTNLSTLIAATMIATLMMSLMIQLRPDDHQPTNIPTPTAKLTQSMTLTLPQSSTLLHPRLTTHSIQLLQSHTDAIPTIQVNSYTTIITTDQCPTYINTPPIISSTLKPHTIHRLSYRPLPDIDQAQEQTEVRVIMAAEKMIIIMRPYQMEEYLYEVLQMMQQVQEWGGMDRMAISKLLVRVSGEGQLLVMLNMHEGGEQVRGWGDRNVGMKLLYVVVIVILSIVLSISWILIEYDELADPYQSLVCRYVYIGGSEQSNYGAVALNKGLMPEELSNWMEVQLVLAGTRVMMHWHQGRSGRRRVRKSINRSCIGLYSEDDKLLIIGCRQMIIIVMVVHV